MLREASRELVAQNSARCRGLVEDLVREVASAAGLAYSGIGSAPLQDEFRRWFEDALASRSVSLERSRVLVRAGTWQVIASLTMRLVAERAWAASAGSVAGMDAAVTGSVPRWEAASTSDFDFDFVALGDDELTDNGLATADRVVKAVEDSRISVMARSDWWGMFLAAADAYYDFAGKTHYAFVLAVPEFNRTRLAMPLGFERYGAHFLSATADLRATAARLDQVRIQARAGLTGADLARKKIDAAEAYLGRTSQRPHTVHGLVSQMWQALLYILRGPGGARLPYWSAPLIVPLIPDAERDWTLLIRALDVSRNEGPSTIGENVAIRGLRGLLTSARRRGLDAANYDRLVAALS